MASNAERQRAYRERHKDGGRINLVCHATTEAKLRRLSRHYGLTRAAMLEKLLIAAESSLNDHLAATERKRYFGD